MRRPCGPTRPRRPSPGACPRHLRHGGWTVAPPAPDNRRAARRGRRRSPAASGRRHSGRGCRRRRGPPPRPRPPPRWSHPGSPCQTRNSAVTPAAAGIADDVHEVRLALRPRLVHPFVGAATGEATLLEDVDDDQAGLEAAGEVDGPRPWPPATRPTRSVASRMVRMGRTSVTSGSVCAASVRNVMRRRGRLGYSVTTRAVTMPNMPSRPSTWGRMWQCRAHTPTRSQSTMASKRSPGLTPSVSQ